MNSSELLISPETLIRIFLFLLYAPVCLIVYWRLIPRLSPISKWIASGMLAAQVVLIVLSLEIRTGSEFEAWLWSLEKESNIPSVFASTQLALVGGLALITGWLARARPVWQRLYLVGVGLVFLYLGWDEFVDWKLATLKLENSLYPVRRGIGGGHDDFSHALAETRMDMALLIAGWSIAKRDRRLFA